MTHQWRCHQQLVENDISDYVNQAGCRENKTYEQENICWAEPLKKKKKKNLAQDMRSGSLVTGLWQSLLKTHSETSITQISAYCLLCSNKQSYPHHVKYASTAHATDEAQRSSNSSANLREAVVKPVMKPRLAGAQASTLTTGTRSFLHGSYTPAGFFLTSAIPILM